jgi:tetratricopeptide (TPR) repeat protein
LCGSMTALAHGPGLEEIDKITAQIAKSGDLPELYRKRAHVFQDNQLWQEALSDLNKAAQLDPQFVEYDLDRARLYFESGEYLSALDFVDLYLIRHQNTTEALLTKARIHFRLEQHREAVESYELALADLSTIDGRPMPDWYVEFADALVLSGNKQGALQALQDGINTLGALSVFQVMSAELEVELGSYDSALERIDQLLSQSQRKDIWLSRKADILAAAGREDEAQQTYQQAYAALQRLPRRLQNLPVSEKLAMTLQARIKNQKQ